LVDLTKVAAQHDVDIDSVLRRSSSSSVATMLGNLARALLDAIQTGQPALTSAWAVNTFLVLSQAPRTVELWRQHFGLCRRVTGYSSPPQENPDCILDVARRVIDDERINHDDRLLCAALRIVANCCADNNTNRSLIVYRDGIQALRNLVKAQRHLDLVLPTLFNVCTDFDEAASNIKGEEDGEISVSCAASDLGKPVGATSMAELLIQTKHERFIPALLELALLPAAFGLKHILDTAARNYMLDPTPLYAAFFTYGANVRPSEYEDPNEWEETRDELSRACISLLRTDDAQIALAKSPGDLWRYLECYWNLTESGKDSPYLAAFRQIVYSVSGSPEYVAAHPVDSDAFGKLVQNFDRVYASCSNSNLIPDCEQITTIMTLIHNAFSTQQHVIDAVTQFPELVLSVLHVLRISYDEYPSTTPAVALLTRFSIVPDARDMLIDGLVFNTLYNILAQARVHRDVLQRPPEFKAARLKENISLINLTRLLIIGRDIVSTLMFSEVQPNLHSEIMQLPIASFDDDAKHDLGEYCVQILRCLAAEDSSAKDLPSYGIKSAPFVAAILHQATSPRSQTTTGIFGLTLLLSSTFTPSLDILDSGAREALIEATRETLAPLFAALAEKRNETETDEPETNAEDSTTSEDAQTQAAQAAKTTAHEANLKRLYMELLRLLGDSKLTGERELYGELERLRANMGL
jgi:hypothetical protein